MNNWCKAKVHKDTGEIRYINDQKNKYMTIKHKNYVMYNDGVHKILAQKEFRKHRPILNFMIDCLEFKTNMCLFENKPLTIKALCNVFERKNIRKMQAIIQFLKYQNIVKKHKGKFFINPFMIAKGRTFLISTIKLFSKNVPARDINDIKNVPK